MQKDERVPPRIADELGNLRGESRVVAHYYRRVVYTRAVLVRAAFTVGAVVLAAAVGASRAEPAAAAATVSVRLTEFRVIPSTSTARAGSVTFVVRNRGKLVHEFVVLRTTRRPGALPVVGGKAKEIGRVGAVRNIQPGQTRRLTLTLRRGSYVLLCNVSGHYAAGQRTGFRVR